ncbi:FRG domain-containing protein [Serratia marcescens]|uniref:FRG domain-containing protein n=1 Tax=Serratia marcescens TaxID=615 RepID=UPI0039896B1E
MEEWNFFLEEIKKATQELGNPREVWFRGHSNCEWQLIPSLVRNDEWKRKEKELFSEFKQSASDLFEKRNSDWETLFDMQHYGIPTRLLDWTTVLGVAIAFVLHGNYDDSSDSAIFVLDPLALNKLSGIDEIVNLPEDKTFGYESIYWLNKPFRADKVIAIKPPVQSNRIRAQKGVFTIHGNSEELDQLEKNAANCFRKVILPSQAKDEARNFLQWANLNEFTIFPDIVGMSQHIRRKVLKGD